MPFLPMINVAASTQRLLTFPHQNIYVAPRVNERIIVDGDLTKPAWERANWSKVFDDIRGPDDGPSKDRPPQGCSTQVKMLWDDEFLYIGALLHADVNHPTMASYTQRNSPIYQEDSDFEIFCDPWRENHNYKEYEVNALNTVWNLMLDKPYNDNGHEHSGRVAKPGEADYYDVRYQHSQTRVLKGTLNKDGCTWSVEVAMSYKDLFVRTGSNGDNKKQTIPKHGDRWNINFSRVERKGDINWTWQPQIVWDAEKLRYRGMVNMHLPDAWGQVYFARDADEEPPPDTSQSIRQVAMNIYYAQHEFKRVKGKYSDQFETLKEYMDPTLDYEIQVNLQVTGDGFLATVTTPTHVATIRDDRLLQVSENEIIE